MNQSLSAPSGDTYLHSYWNHCETIAHPVMYYYVRKSGLNPKLLQFLVALFSISRNAEVVNITTQEYELLLVDTNIKDLC